MADNNIQGENSSLDAEESREFAARRAVIKGLVSAIPVILTVSSGEALANASNLQCIQNPPALEPTQCIDAAQDDAWVRRLTDVDDGTGTGTMVEKNCLIYAYEDGEISLEPGAQVKPFTHSCYNSFMP